MKQTLIALTLAATMVAPIANAGGSISLTINAQTAQEADAIRTGLVMYKAFKDIKTNGHISQDGLNNVAALVQGGPGNVGIIHQDGDGHDASLNQQNGNNSCGVFQFGQNTSNHVQQNGGEACLVFSAGF